MRRPAALVAALAVAGLAVAAPAAAETATSDSGSWKGSSVTLTAGGNGMAYTMDFVWERPVGEPRNPERFRLQLVVPEPQRSDCSLPGMIERTVPAARPGGERVSVGQLSGEVPLACNGTYRVEAHVAALWEPTFGGERFEQISSNLLTVDEMKVANPPGAPKDVAATRASSGKVTLTWAAPSGTSAPDFTGYVVERTVDGKSTILASDLDELTFLDDDVELGPGDEATYRVKATRTGATEGSSVASPAATATVSVPVPTPTTEGPGTGPDGTGDDGDPNEGGQDGQDPGVGEAGSGRGPVAMPRTGSGRPPVGPMRPVTPTTIDTGYQESLPFDPDRMTGPRDAVLPDDELASLIFDDGDGGAGLAVPGATAAVLAVWALHLRHLNRLARTDP